MSHFLADDGEKIHIQVSGEGAPIVFLHGWTSSHQDCFPFVGALNAHRRVYRWDARGHGAHAAHTGKPPTIERMAGDSIICSNISISAMWWLSAIRWVR